MSTVLEIRDGASQWWMSPDIWVVPGNDPDGSPAPPIEGRAAFLWGRVRNAGEQAVSGAQVCFYWSNPSTGVLRSNSTLVGASFVDLNPGETKEVLCVIPWIPEIVNNGHECVVAEIVHPSDPLPSPLQDQFDAPEYNQIAQKNLNVLPMQRSIMVMPIQVAAPARRERHLLIRTGVGGKLDDLTLAQAGLKGYRPGKSDDLKKVGLSLDRGCYDMEEVDLDKEIKLSLKPGTSKAVFLKVWPQELEKKAYVLLHVISKDGQNIEGGITYILIKG
ncbi:MAG: hypothetical protein GY860_00365 [Desulfobacteraceae bacterium]|nr:hypothetical protein [Desulfobacteraceae bacterium]